MSFQFGQSGGDPFQQLATYIDSQLRKVNCLKGCSTTSASAPTTSDIGAGKYTVWKNTTDGTVKLYYNDAGSLKSVTLS